MSRISTLPVSLIPRRLRLLILIIPLLFFWSLPASAGDAFLKGGIQLRPSDVGVSDRWFLAAGADWGIERLTYFGFELQSAFYSDPPLNKSGTRVTVPINGFINFKLKSPAGGARPFAGAGVGLISTYFHDAVETDYTADFGYHLMGGLEMGSLEGKALLLELEAQQNLSADDKSLNLILFIGLRF